MIMNNIPHHPSFILSIDLIFRFSFFLETLSFSYYNLSVVVTLI